MKIRKSFVANSSSSSFVCEICGETRVSWDDVETVGMVRCVNEHIICDEHRLNDDSEDSPDWGHCASESSCPICQFQTYSQPELKNYLIETRGVDPAVVFAEIKQVNKRRKKLYDEEYITHVLKQFELTDELILDELKSKFGTYAAFRDRDRGK